MNGLSKKVCGAALMGLLLAGESVLAINMADVQVTQWFGSGSKQALMVVDWQEPQTVVFGYRWEGTATGADLINAVQAANIGFERVWHPGFVGETVFGMGFDVDGSGDVDHMGLFVHGQPGYTTETGHANYANDYYKEGWDTGYWAYYSSRDGATWSYMNEGLARTLADGDWEGWAFATPPTWYAVPDNIPLIPEPATISLLMVAAGAVLATRRNSRHNAV